MRRATSASDMALRGGLLALALTGSGCATSPPSPLADMDDPAPYHLLPPDEMMSCAAIADSFHYAAQRAARLKFGLALGSRGTYGTGHFKADAPEKLKQEEERLDALNDLQRVRGCPIIDPVEAVAFETERLMPVPLSAGAPSLALLHREPVLHARD